MIWRNQTIVRKKGKHFVIYETFFVCEQVQKKVQVQVPFFHSKGNLPSFTQSLKTFDSSLKIAFPHNSIICILSLSWQWASYGFKQLIILAISLSVLVDYQERHGLVFSLKFAMNLFSCKNEVCKVIFYHSETFLIRTNMSFN